MDWANQHDWDRFHFLAVARAGQILGAAQQLGLNHATVGRQLTALEEDLGAKLVERQTQGCTLTPAGEALAQICRARWNREVLQVGSEISGARAAISGTVRIGAPDGLGNYFLARALGHVGQQPSGSYHSACAPAAHIFALAARS